MLSYNFPDHEICLSIFQDIQAFQFNETAMPGEKIKGTPHAVLVSILSVIFKDIIWYCVSVSEVDEWINK